MPRVLVISDTHGYITAAVAVIKSHGPWEAVIHLGDAVDDARRIEEQTGLTIITVRGNNEYPAPESVPEERVWELNGVRLYMIHGHTLDINHHRGDEHMAGVFAHLTEAALRHNAQIVLFGHTHHPLCLRQNNILFFNPGGIGLGDQKKTYGEISINRGGEILAEIKYAGAMDGAKA